MTLERDLTLDISPEAKPQTVKVKQSDDASNVFTLSFINSLDDSNVTIAAGQTVKFRCVKPSGASHSISCSVSNGNATLTLDAESTAENGLVYADVTIEENNVILSTAPLWLDVVRSAVSTSAGGSSGGGGSSIVCTDDGDGNITIAYAS